MDEVNLRKVEQATELLLQVLESLKATQQPAPAPPPPPSTEGQRRLVVWGEGLDNQFIQGVLWIEDQLGLNADFLMTCMKFESGISPTAKNPASSATGLIQFMDATVRSMQKTYPQLLKLFPQVKRARDLASLTAVQQLTWVYYYFKAFGNDLGKWSLEDTYMAILLPTMIGKPLDSKMAWNENAYRVNAGLDLNKDKVITKREATEKIRRLYAQGKEHMG